MGLRDCEVCGGEVKIIIKATQCGHPVYLCNMCKKVCEGALRVCLKCEEKGL